MVAAFGLLLAAIPAFAQHGGGHASGSHGGFSSHSSGSGSHFGGMRSGSGLASRGIANSRQAFSRPLSGRGSNSNRFASSRFRNFGSRNCVGCRRYGYPWGYAGFYDPYWWGAGSSYDEDRARDLDIANQSNQQSLDEQQMRQQGDQDLYARTPQGQTANTAAAPTEMIPPTVLVFHDQHKEEIQNYAIVGSALWSFSAQRAKKIPLADLDLTATAEANDDRGVSFRLPRAPEGQ
jgi:hypothetical protein